MLVFEALSEQIPAMRITNKLTDPQVKNLKPAAVDLKLSDGGGMFLLVKPDGAKYWRLGYRFLGKQKTLSLGVYPEITLKTARERRSEARKLLDEGIDPGLERKLRKTALEEDSFEAVARDWHMRQVPKWSEVHAKTVMERLENNLFPWIGTRPVKEISAPSCWPACAASRTEAQLIWPIGRSRQPGKYSGMPSPSARRSATPPPICAEH